MNPQDRKKTCTIWTLLVRQARTLNHVILSSGIMDIRGVEDYTASGNHPD